MAAKELNNTVLKNNTNLKAYYRFESGAETTDSSGNSNTLTAIGTPTYSAGKFGQSVDLASASSQNFTITDNSDLKPTTSFTLLSWFKTSTTGQIQALINSYSDAGSKVAGISLQCDSSNVAAFLSGKNSGVTANTDYKQITGTTNITDGNWHLIVGTWDGATMRLYVDGKHETSAAWANAPVYQATNYVRIGVRYNGSSNQYYVNGSLDDVCLLNGTALSADQIKELYEGRTLGEGWPQSGLVGLWHLNGNSTDFSGNNNHGTDTNMTYGLSYGKFLQGGSFGGTSKIVTANPGGIDGGAITMSGWFKLPADIGSGEWMLFAQYNGNTKTAYQVRYQYNSGTRRLYFDRQKTGTADQAFTYNITLGTTNWYYIVLTYDTTNVYGYINGNSVGSVAASGNGVTSVGTNFLMGDHIGGTLAYVGYMDEVQVYNVAKSADWVRKQYALGVGKYL